MEATRSGLLELDLMQRGLSVHDRAPDSAVSGAIATIESSNDISPLLPPTEDRKESRDQLERRREWAKQNWLIDGMRKAGQSPAESAREMETSAAEERARPLLEGRSVGSESDQWLSEAIDAQSSSDAHRAPIDESKLSASVPADDVVNPLEGFMAQWMTPGDLKLLRPTAEGANPGKRSVDKLAVSIGPKNATEAPPAGAAFNGFTLTNRTGDAGTNPFLPAVDISSFTPIESAPSRAPARATNVLQTSQSDRPAPVYQPTEPTATEKKTGEPWRPPARDDEKYFPRMKRF